MALGSQAYPRNPQLLVPPFTQTPPQSSTDLVWRDEPVRALLFSDRFPIVPNLSSTFLFVVPPPSAHTSREKPQIFRL